MAPSKPLHVSPRKPKGFSSLNSIKPSVPRSLEDFLAPALPLTEEVPHTRPTPAEETAAEISQLRERFISRIPVGDEELCAAVDRTAVINVLNEAISKVKLPTNQGKHSAIFSEAIRKIKVVLDITRARPEHDVFLAPGSLLAPLEPQYAQPRIRYEDGDEHGHLSQWRLNAWREHGWPLRFPEKAVRTERRPTGRLVGTNTAHDIKLRTNMVKWTDEDWGGVLPKEEERRPPRKWRRLRQGRSSAGKDTEDED